MKAVRHTTVIILAFLAMSVLSCRGFPEGGLDRQCIDGVSEGFRDLEAAKVGGLGDSMAWGKAASLLTAAKVQQQFEKWPNCVNKVKRARYYLDQLR